MSKKSLILNDTEIRHKIRRIAYEIYENNFREKEVVLAGIIDQGHKLAEYITEVLTEIAPFKVKLIKVLLDKEAPTQSDIELSCDISELENKSIILIDDVLNTGRTMAYSLKPFLNVKVKKLEGAVLVNRSHTNFPISTQYTGYELATSIMEHVHVNLDEDKKEVYLL